LHKLTLLVLGAVVLGTWQVGSAQVADPRIGAWTLTSAQSSLDPPNKLVIVSEHGTVHVAISGENHLDFTAKLDGSDASVPSNPLFDQVELHRVNKHQVDVKQKKDGALVATIRDKISPNGNELISTTLQSGRPDKITVWTRSGQKKSAIDLFAGEWTEDLSKTRMRQGMTLKIEAQGNGGVQFTSDYSYNARFDGKDYDLKNSSNDTVMLQLVDAHTVDAIYKRDNQVTQKDQWVVSADGQQMTLTTSGTLETGQKLTETLVFKK
jgi:hypothetical protein